MNHVVFTGARHEVGVDQMFFSTTDRRGTIGFSNKVFVELSRYTRSQLVGAPHNIIRHPEMPGGAFRAMWDALRAGKPFAAYVRNLAADGSEYDVFATVTPLDSGGYLSVRIRPTCEDLFEKTLGIYEDVKAFEDSLRAEGMNRREVALRGATRIVELLRETGLASYEELQNAALPAEVERHEELSEGFPERPDAVGELARMLGDVRAIADELDVWMGQQSALAELSAALRRTGAEIERWMANADFASTAVDNLRADPDAGPLVELMDVWGQMQEIVRRPVDRLLDTLARLDANSSQMRFQVALARLHTTMMATFTAELIDGGADCDVSASAIGTLAHALRQGLLDMERQAVAHGELAAETADCIEQAKEFVSIPRQLLMLWDQEENGRELSEGVAELASAVSTRIDVVGEDLAKLDSLAERCRAFETAKDSSRLGVLVDRVEGIAGQIGAQAE